VLRELAAGFRGFVFPLLPCFHCRGELVDLCHDAGGNEHFSERVEGERRGFLRVPPKGVEGRSLYGEGQCYA
jgi:hypothetical protein